VDLPTFGHQDSREVIFVSAFFREVGRPGRFRDAGRRAHAEAYPLECPVPEVRWHSDGAASRPAALLLLDVSPGYDFVVAPCRAGATASSVRQRTSGTGHQKLPTRGDASQVGRCGQAMS